MCVYAWGLWSLCEPWCVCVCVCVYVHLQWVFHLLSNWPPEGQWAGRRLTSWSRWRWPFREGIIICPPQHSPIHPPSHPSISLLICLPLRGYSNPTTSFLMPLFSFSFSFPLIHSSSYSIIPPSICICSACLHFAHQSTSRTLLKCLLAMCYLCRVWCGCI